MERNHMSVKFMDIPKERAKYLKDQKQTAKEFKGLSPYDFLIQIADKKTKHDYDKRIAPAHLLLAWFSHDSYCCDIVQAINHLQFDLKDDIIYQYLFLTIPKNMAIPKWVKKEKLKDDERIEKIKLKYNVSTNEALMILNHKERINDQSN
jgi:hypothetical protein